MDTDTRWHVLSIILVTTHPSEIPLAWMNAGASPILPFSLIPSSRLPLFERRPLTIRESRYMTLIGTFVPWMKFERRKTVEEYRGGMGVLKHTIAILDNITPHSSSNMFWMILCQLYGCKNVEETIRTSISKAPPPSSHQSSFRTSTTWRSYFSRTGNM